MIGWIFKVHLDPTISLGSLLSAVIVLLVGLAGWWAFRARVDAVLENQRDLMVHLTNRFESHEGRDEELFRQVQDRLADLAGGMQRLIGRFDASGDSPWPLNRRRGGETK